MKNFPKFKSHDEAFCFNCDGDFGPGGYWTESGFAKGNGEFVQQCQKCGSRTWYDVGRTRRPKFMLENTGADRFKLRMTQ